MARILVVKPLFPYPPHQGTRRVSLGLLGDLAAAHEVVYLCQREQRDEERWIPEIERLGVRVVAPLMPNHLSPAHKAAYKAKNRLLSQLTGTPELALYWSNAVLRGSLARLGREFRPALTIIENWELYRLRRSIGRGLAALLAHDAAFQILARAAAADSDERSKARRLQRLAREKRLEVAAWRLYDAVLTLTESDRETVLEELREAARDDRGLSAGARAHAAALPLVQHLPVPVAEEFFAFERPAAARWRIGFLGTFRADFNRDALGYLLREIWPAVHQALPQAELIVAGNGYAGELRAQAEAAGARWLGFVADLRRFYERIDLLAVPLRFGGGVRIRILEALAAGVPVVATPIAAAGLGVSGGRQLLLAAGAGELVQATIGLLKDQELAAELGRAGRAWCAEHHGVQILRPRRLAAIQAILDLAGRAADRSR
ncbi:MAG: glycosyltransferase [Candidatus Eisenbacteria bacterium]|uniref:Glycosyltransferase n=1 Tax=Eiseniibacteriota bacterium TaxID=2212470 RepID=A0A937X754_UNCEI|nr:glycosyltransferase [Candidatus Eisenbacteria bacterium]